MFQGQVQILTDGQERLDSYYQASQSMDTRGKTHLFSYTGPTEYGFLRGSDRPGIIWCGSYTDPEEVDTMAKKWRKRLGGRPIFKAPQGRFFLLPPSSPTEEGVDEVYEYMLDAVHEYERVGQELLNRKEEEFSRPPEPAPEPDPELANRPAPTQDGTTTVDENGVVHLNFEVPESEPPKKKEIPKEQKYNKPLEEDIQDFVQNPYCVVSIMYKYENYEPEKDPRFVIRFEGSGRDNLNVLVKSAYDRYRETMSVLTCQYGTWVELMASARNVEKRTTGVETLEAAHSAYMNPKALGLVNEY